MAIIFEDALKKNLSAKTLLPVYILFGEDGYLKKSYSEKISGFITEPDDIFNCCKFSSECDLQEVYNAAMQLPFMAEKKYIELCDFDFEHCSKSELDRLCELIKDTPDTAVLVLRFDSIDFDSKKSAKFKKIVSAAEKNNGVAVRLDHRKLPELVKMLTDGAAKRGCRMDSSTARYLVEISGDDINLLRNELDKLCSYVQNGTVTKDTVDRVSVKTVEASVYNLSKYITERDISSALKVLDELFFMRVEPMIILYTVSSVYVDMMRIYSAKSKGLSVKDVAEKYGYRGKEFVLERASGNLRNFDGNKLDLSLKALTRADRELKSFGADGRVILEKTVTELIYIIVKGESFDKA